MQEQPWRLGCQLPCLSSSRPLTESNSPATVKIPPTTAQTWSEEHPAKPGTWEGLLGLATITRTCLLKFGQHLPSLCLDDKVGQALLHSWNSSAHGHGLGSRAACSETSVVVFRCIVQCPLSPCSARSPARSRTGDTATCFGSISKRRDCRDPSMTGRAASEWAKRFI